MRRAAALAALPLLAVVAVAGCGSSSPAKSSPSTAASNSVVTATGNFGAAPKVTIPAEKAAPALYTKTLIQGGGDTLTATQTLEGNFVLYDWSGTTHKLLGSTYNSGGTLFAGQMIPGLQTALIGQKIGSRVLAVIPPKDAFGSSGNSQIGVKATDTLVFVIDLVKSFSNTAGVPGAQTSNGGGALPTVTMTAGKPVISIPASAPPKTLQVKTLIKGPGAKVKSGEELMVQYTGVIWRTKKVFDSSWSRNQPYTTPIGVGQVIKG